MDVYSVIHSFVRRVLISENIVKYRFNKTWDAKQKKYKENIIGYALCSIQTSLIAGTSCYVISTIIIVII